MDLIITTLPVVTKDLPISLRFTPYNFLSRCKFSILTTRQPIVEFYLLTFPRFPLRKKEHKSYSGKNRTRDFRTSRCAAYLLDHSGDELKGSSYPVPYPFCWHSLKVTRSVKYKHAPNNRWNGKKSPWTCKTKMYNSSSCLD